MFNIANHLIKQNVFQKNVNIPLKNIEVSFKIYEIENY